MSKKKVPGERESARRAFFCLRFCAMCGILRGVMNDESEMEELENEDYLPYVYQEVEQLRRMVRFQGEVLQNLHVTLVDLARGVELFYKLVLYQVLAAALIFLLAVGWAVFPVVGSLVGFCVWLCLLGAWRWRRKSFK